MTVKAFVLSFSAKALAELNFLIMGDWGGAPVVGTTPGEVATAKAMGTEAEKLSASFSLALGDNFYSSGIQSDEFDSRFQSTFENVFTADSLKSENFFRVLAGNHDHKGNTTAQIAYSAHSERWHYPALYYSFVEKVDESTTAEFVMIDTVTLSGPSACPVTGEELQGSDPRMEEMLNRNAAQTQYQWLEATLAASEADFLFVSGHYPVWSVCEHGPTQSLVDTLKPLMEKYKVSAYFSGHDHCEQHIDDGAGVQYHVIGAAHLQQHSDKNRDKVPSDQLKFLDLGTVVLSYAQGGFASVQIASKDAGAAVTHYRSKATDYTAMYTAPSIPARSVALVV